MLAQESPLANRLEIPNFWVCVFANVGSASKRVLPRTLGFMLYGALFYFIHQFKNFPEINITPFEVAGALLTLVLVFRTNAGYDRWWEARKIWGGIVNQVRNTLILMNQYGPESQKWQVLITHYLKAYPYTLKIFLRKGLNYDEVKPFLSSQDFSEFLKVQHKPAYIITKLTQALHDARLRGLDDYSFLQIDQQKNLLLDYSGMCERILNTPMPFVYAIEVRRFIIAFMLFIPISLMHHLGIFTPFATGLISYGLLCLDQIGKELQNPFSEQHLSHLPLNTICKNIEINCTEIFSLRKTVTHKEKIGEL